MITPDDPFHAALEAEVIAVAESQGWLVAAATYHSVMPPAVKLALSRCYDIAALYVRARADRVAVKDQRCVMFEAKTGSSTHDCICLESLPVSHYVRLGIPCLYVYRNRDGFQAAFWTTDMPAIEKMLIPDRWSLAFRQFYTNQFRSLWPDVEIQIVPWRNGSGDPYMLIRRELMTSKAVDWRAVFAGTGAAPELVATDFDWSL